MVMTTIDTNINTIVTTIIDNTIITHNDNLHTDIIVLDNQPINPEHQEQEQIVL
jgi:hypothetical protein